MAKRLRKHEHFGGPRGSHGEVASAHPWTPPLGRRPPRQLARPLLPRAALTCGRPETRGPQNVFSVCVCSFLAGVGGRSAAAYRSSAPTCRLSCSSSLAVFRAAGRSTQACLCFSGAAGSPARGGTSPSSRSGASQSPAPPWTAASSLLFGAGLFRSVARPGGCRPRGACGEARGLLSPEALQAPVPPRALARARAAHRSAKGQGW